MDDILRQVIGVYVEEVREQAQRITQALLVMENDPSRVPTEIEELYRQAHSLKGSSGSLGIVELEQLAHWLESALTGVRRGKERLTPALVDAGLQAMEAAQIRTAGLIADNDIGADDVQRVTESLRILVEGMQPRVADEGRRAPESERSQSPESESSIRPSATSGPDGLPEIADVIRVSIDRLAAFERRSDELRSLRGRLDRHAGEIGHVARQLDKLLRDLRGHSALDSSQIGALREELQQFQRTLRGTRRDLIEDVDSLQVTTAEFEENLRALRLVPASLLAQPIQLAVREAARVTAREVQLTITGDQVHLDRLLLEELKNPLLHLVRNAVDHGIESMEVREAIGKPARGRIEVAIEQRGGQIEVKVSDDGRGIDPTVVRAKAVERGLLSESEAESLSEQEVYKLLLLPGFSTAQTVTNISGRGVGLDVVRNSVVRLHGQLDIESSIGEGTHFIISVPMTVVASRMLLLRDRDWPFALPQASVLRVVLVRRDRLISVGGHTVIELEGQTVVVARLSQLLKIGEHYDEAASLPLILLRAPGTPVGVLCERILGEHDLILRALPLELQSHRQLSAAALLPNGTAVFVLAASALIEMAMTARPLAIGSPLRPGTILVADDSITTRSLLRSVLEVGGYQVRTAADGDEALRLLRSEPVNLVVSDVRMPRLDGLGLIARLRADPRTSGIPVVLFSSSDSEEDRRRGLASGANAFLSKSAFDRGHLVDVVKNLLRGVA